MTFCARGNEFSDFLKGEKIWLSDCQIVLKDASKWFSAACSKYHNMATRNLWRLCL